MKVFDQALLFKTVFDILAVFGDMPDPGFHLVVLSILQAQRYLYQR